MDINHFKNINDTYRYHGGDVVLRHLSEMMQETFRLVDIMGRIGGEEFTILLQEMTLECAVKLAERLRKKSANTKFF